VKAKTAKAMSDIIKPRIISRFGFIVCSFSRTVT
jgi:hypothetical protein